MLTDTSREASPRGKVLSILIPSLASRTRFRQRILGMLEPQLEVFGDAVELLTDVDDGAATIGAKRNSLLARAEGRYVCFVDDDDRVGQNYVALIMQALEIEPDCCSLYGEITFQKAGSLLRRPFRHSIRYAGHYFTNGTYYRTPNHLNAIRADFARAVGFDEDMRRGEDTDFSKRLHRAGLLKIESEISQPIYFYDYVENKTRNYDLS